MASTIKNAKPQIASQQIATNVNALYETTIEKYLNMGYKYKGTPGENAATLKYTRKDGSTIAIIVFEGLVLLSSIPIYDMLASDIGQSNILLVNPVSIVLVVTTLLTHIYSKKMDIRITKTNSVQTVGFTEKKMKIAIKRKNIIRAIASALCVVLLVYLAITRF